MLGALDSSYPLDTFHQLHFSLEFQKFKTLDMTGYEVEKQGWIHQWEKALKVQKQWGLNQNKDER